MLTQSVMMSLHLFQNSFHALEEIPEVYFLLGGNFQTQFTVASVEFDVSPGFMWISYSEEIAHIHTGVDISVYLCVRVCEVYYIHYYLRTYVRMYIIRILCIICFCTGGYECMHIVVCVIKDKFKVAHSQ